MKRDPVRPISASNGAGYPTRDSNPHAGCSDASRRRFLRQLATAGVVGITGLPRLGQAQDLSPNFSVLDRHPTASPPRAEAEEQVEEEREVSTEADSLVEAEPMEGAEGAWVEEDRALYIDPGYLVLVRWRRPEDALVVAAFEGATTLVHDWLVGRVTSVDNLHNLDQLHVIESELQIWLQALIAPATISVLHLDHDCVQVCSTLNPSRTYPERIMVEGEVSSPGWE